jgi:hypothetical protein
MKWERMILIAFLGNYLVNNIAAGLASLVPASQGGNPMLSAQYLTFVVLAAITTGLMAWWYLNRMMREGGLMAGITFGVVGFVVAVLTAFVTGIAGVLLQTGSLSQVGSVLPNFGPYLFQWTTLVLLFVWLVPGAIVGWMMEMRMSRPAASMPMQSM